MDLLVPAILLVFYLYLVVRWEHVRRPFFLCVGVLGMVTMLFFLGFFGFTAARWSRVLQSVVGTLAMIVTFGCAMAACWGSSLPMGLGKKSEPQAPAGSETPSTPQKPASGGSQAGKQA